MKVQLVLLSDLERHGVRGVTILLHFIVKYPNNSSLIKYVNFEWIVYHS